MVWIRGTISAESQPDGLTIDTVAESAFLSGTGDGLGASNQSSPVDGSENALGCAPNSLAACESLSFTIQCNSSGREDSLYAWIMRHECKGCAGCLSGCR